MWLGKMILRVVHGDDVDYRRLPRVERIEARWLKRRSRKFREPLSTCMMSSCCTWYSRSADGKTPCCRGEQGAGLPITDPRRAVDLVHLHGLFITTSGSTTGVARGCILGVPILAYAGPTGQGNTVSRLVTCAAMSVPSTSLLNTGGDAGHQACTGSSANRLKSRTRTGAGHFIPFRHPARTSKRGGQKHQTGVVALAPPPPCSDRSPGDAGQGSPSTSTSRPHMGLRIRPSGRSRDRKAATRGMVTGEFPENCISESFEDVR